MKLYTLKEAKALSCEDAEAAITTAVYEATRLIETLEHAGRLSGNGHHARQKLAELSRQELASRWA
jgi:hypothetical protein